MISSSHYARVGEKVSLHLSRISCLASRETKDVVRRFSMDNSTSASMSPKIAINGLGSNLMRNTRGECLEDFPPTVGKAQTGPVHVDK